MKRIVAIIIAVLTCVSLVACSSNTDSSSKNTTKNSSLSTNENSDKSEEKTFDAKKVSDEINSKYKFENMTQLDDAMFLDIMYGVKNDDVKQFIMMINETGISADEIIVIEGVNEEATARVFELISNWYIAKGAQMKDYIPEEYDKINKCSVKVKGNIVYMVVLDNSKEIEDIIEKYI